MIVLIVPVGVPDRVLRIVDRVFALPGREGLGQGKAINIKLPWTAKIAGVRLVKTLSKIASKLFASWQLRRIQGNLESSPSPFTVPECPVSAMSLGKPS